MRDIFKTILLIYCSQPNNSTSEIIIRRTEPVQPKPKTQTRSNSDGKHGKNVHYENGFPLH